MKHVSEFQRLAPKPRSVRTGISVIEVLAAMVVALIGVFGVLVLIPFSVKQAQLGLDQDAASLLAENAIEEMQIREFTRVNEQGRMQFRGSRVLPQGSANALGAFESAVNISSAVVFGANTGSASPNFFPVQTLGLSIRNPRPFHFDPVAVAGVGFPTADTSFPGYAGLPDYFNNGNLNPDFLTRNLPDTNIGNALRLTVATAISKRMPMSPGVNHLLGRSETQRLFRSHDDLVFGKPEKDLLGNDLGDLEIPQPEFDRSSDGNIIRRQSNGRLSWSAVFVPQKGPFVKLDASEPPTVTTRYKVYVLVYRDRSVIPSDADSVMLAAPVIRHDSSGPANPEEVGGFVAAIDQVLVDATVFDPVTESSLVTKDDWVMLINRRPPPDYPAVGGLPLSAPLSGTRLAADEDGYDVQIGFAKVQSVRQLDAGAYPNASALSLNGGAFNFYFTDVPNSETFAIHLKNVITVYERTITLERNSVWN